MIVKKEKLRKYLDKQQISKEEFAKELDVDISEVDKMLNGERIGYETSKKFIYYMKAARAQKFINWKETGVKNPLNKK